MTWKKLLNLIVKYRKKYPCFNIALVIYPDGSGSFRDMDTLVGRVYLNGLRESFNNLSELQKICRKT